jgi:hypothetical protein
LVGVPRRGPKSEVSRTSTWKIGNCPEVAASHTAQTGVLVNHKEDTMELYAILRRNGWKSGAELGQAAERSTQVGNEQMADDIRWIRSYVLDEPDGSVGTVCIYEATSPEAIREHASLADLPVDEIVQISGTVIVRPDPEPAVR